MSALGHKRTFRRFQPMSAFPKADISLYNIRKRLKRRS
jgi:hypothetical protein